MQNRCTRCGTINPEGQPVCTTCGNNLQFSNPIPPGQRPRYSQAPNNPSGPPPGYRPAPPQGGYSYPPNQGPHPGQYGQQRPQRPPVSESEMGKQFSNMLNAHKADAAPIRPGDNIPPRNYPAIKLFMTLMRIFSWIFAVLFVIAGIGAGIIAEYVYPPVRILYFIVGPVFGVFYLVLGYASIDLFRLLINIEDNTRRSANNILIVK